MAFDETLSYYQKSARTTALVKERIYYILGLVGEIGELANTTKKIIRDDNGKITASRRGKFKKELGDALWYMANICEEFSLDMDELHAAVAKDGYVERDTRIIYLIVIGMCRQASEVSKIYENLLRSPDNMDEIPALTASLVKLFGFMMEFCDSCSIDIFVVAEMNLEKLFNRMERGTLRGDGDDR